MNVCRAEAPEEKIRAVFTLLACQREVQVLKGEYIWVQMQNEWSSLVHPLKNYFGDTILQIKPALYMAFSTAMGKYKGNYFILAKGRGLPWPLGKTASESWVTILASKPIQCNRESENITSTYKHKTLLLLILIMLSFLSEGLLKDTLQSIKIYRKILQMRALLWMLICNSRFWEPYSVFNTMSFTH